MAGVLAHEISYIRNHDLHIMTIADLITRLTHVLSVIAFLIILLSLPFVITGDFSLSLAGLLILMLAPSINTLLQLGLSRVRACSSSDFFHRILQSEKYQSSEAATKRSLYNSV